MRAWLHVGDLHISVPREGLWIGRSPDCDLVVDDHRISQVHALLIWRGDGLELLSLGRNPTRVNGAPVEVRCPLVDGSEIEVPGATWTVSIPPSPRRGAWVAVLPSGQRVGLGFRRMVLGGGPDDDIRLAGSPRAAMTLHHTSTGSLLAEAGTSITLGGVPLEAGDLEEVQSGSEARLGDPTVTLLALASTDPATTLVAQDAHLPVRAEFCFTPTGGRLTLGFAAGTDHTIELPELRARLIAVLLAHPDDEVEDEDVLAGVWPGATGRTRLDLNQLVHRARKDLLAAGVDPTPILIRPRRGGAVRFRVASGAAVSLT